MCIICNCGDAGFDFLTDHGAAAGRMRAAKAKMLECSRIATEPEQRKRYDRMHKKMARLIREWNRIEQEREVHFERPAMTPDGSLLLAAMGATNGDAVTFQASSADWGRVKAVIAFDGNDGVDVLINPGADQAAPRFDVNALKITLDDGKEGAP
jgi:hypothetical protein